MAILVKFRENKKADSDLDVIGRAMEGDHEGKVCFLTQDINDPSQYIDQEVMCEVVRVRERSLVVRPVSSQAQASTSLDARSLFKDSSQNQKKEIDPNSIFRI